ncbi:MAG: hypothetical protein GX560_03750, partial [Deinococcales bacterium]|nr:hypothetical protein [Deinococcales bacterium]
IGAAVLGTVLSVTLAAAFAGNLAGGPLGPPAGQAGAQAPASAADVERAVREAMGAQLARLEAAFDTGDAASIRATLDEAGVPEAAQVGILQGYEASAGSPEARERLVSGLHERFEQQVVEVVAQVDAGVRASFTEAVTRVFTYVLYVVALAWLVTLFLPVLPLRETLDVAPPGE